MNPDNGLRNLTRTIKVIFLSQFLQFASAVNKITLSRKPGYAHLPTCKLLYRDSKVASIQLVPRNCTSAFEPTFCTVTQKWSHLSLYRDRASSQASLYLDGKNCAMHSLISASVNYLRHDKFHFAGFQSLSNKNANYCRAVSCHRGAARQE